MRNKEFVAGMKFGLQNIFELPPIEVLHNILN